MTATANLATSGLLSDQLQTITAAITSTISTSDDVTASALPSTSSTGSVECCSLIEEQITEPEILLEPGKIKPYLKAGARKTK